MASFSPLRRITSPPQATRQLLRPSFSPNPRKFHLTTSHLARKDAQDRKSVKPESTEYSKSGGDGTAAEAENAAFDPNSTRPEEEHRVAGKEKEGESGGNPLDASPANHSISQPHDPQAGRKEGSPTESGRPSERNGGSGAGSPKKNGR